MLAATLRMALSPAAVGLLGPARRPYPSGPRTSAVSARSHALQLFG